MVTRKTTALALAWALAWSAVAATPSTNAHAQDKSAKKTPAAAVGFDPVIREQAHQTVPVVGRLVAQRSGVVSVLVQGVVADMRVRVGDRVATGEVVAQISPNRLKWLRELRAAEVESAKASLANAKTQASLRRQELKRLENLKKSAAFSAARFEDAQKELTKAESDAARAEADLTRATANLNVADIDLNNTSVRAPYDGVVSAVHTEIGTHLSTGASVISLVDDANMEVEADVPAARVAGLIPGVTVTVSTGSAKSFTATVRAVVPNENPLTRTRAVRFTPADGGIVDGAAANQSVSIAIPAGPKRDVLSVHKDAVLNKGGRRVVFVLEDGKAVLRPVTLGDAVGMRFIVLNGLSAGDMTVVRGNERLTPGQAISGLEQ